MNSIMDAPLVSAMHATQDIAASTNGALLRGLLNAARADAVIQDQIDCAQFASVSGLHSIAETLYGSVALHLGASPVTFALLRQAKQQTQVPPPDGGFSNPAPTGFCVDVAIEELRRLMALAPQLAAAPDFDALLPEPFSMGAQPSPDLGLLADLGNRAAAALREVPIALQQRRLRELLLPLAGEMSVLEPVYIEAHLGLDLPAVIDIFALEQLRRFVMRNIDLIQTESSSAFLDETANLHRGALGPYFTNVRLLLRNHRDFSALIDVAAGGQATDEEFERWALLLSAHLTSHEVADLVDDLGDRGMLPALRRILGRLARTGSAGESFEITRRICDAGLDLEDLRLATDAQRLILRWRPTHSNEWRLLGAIQAAMGEQELARVSFGRALFFQHDNNEAKVDLALLEAGRPAPIQSGFNSSSAQRRVRRVRLQAFQRNALSQ
jgi:hypothetical protein